MDSLPLPFDLPDCAKNLPGICGRQNRSQYYYFVDRTAYLDTKTEAVSSQQPPQRVVQSKIHRGISVQRYRIPDGALSITPKDLFERVQMGVEKNRRTPARTKSEEEYLLTTKLFCGHCGRMMIGESGKSHTGVIHRYYKCNGAKRRLDCHKKAVKKDWMERIAVQYTADLSG